MCVHVCVCVLVGMRGKTSISVHRWQRLTLYLERSAASLLGLLLTAHCVSNSLLLPECQSLGGRLEMCMVGPLAPRTVAHACGTGVM